MSRLILVIVALGLLVGCAGSPDTQTDDGGADTPVTDGGHQPSGGPPAPSDAGTRPALPPARTVHPDAVDLLVRPFDSAVADETDGSLHVLYFAGREPCYVLGPIDVIARPDTVTVTLREGRDPTQMDAACTDDAQLVSTRVPLDGRLGDRLLIDGSDGREVPVEVVSAADAAAS